MEGEIPDSLYNLSNLKVLILHNNIPGFRGSLKTNIGNLTKLTDLTLNANPLLSGTLPSELGRCEDLGKMPGVVVDMLHCIIFAFILKLAAINSTYECHSYRIFLFRISSLG